MKNLIHMLSLTCLGYLLIALFSPRTLFAQPNQPYMITKISGMACQNGTVLKLGNTISNLDNISFGNNLDAIILKHIPTNNQIIMQASGCKTQKPKTGSCNCTNKTTSKSSSKSASAAGIRVSNKAEVDEEEASTAKKCAPTMKLDVPYNIISKVEGKALDISKASGAPGAAVVIFQPNKGDSQKWMLRAISGKPGFYAIQSNMGTVLDISEEKAVKDTPLKTGIYEKDHTQEWRLQCSNEVGWYYLKTASGLYLDVKGGHGDDGTIVHLYTKNQSDAQKWKFVP